MTTKFYFILFYLILFHFENDANAIFKSIFGKRKEAGPEYNLMSADLINYQDRSCLDKYKGMYSWKYDEEARYFIDILGEGKFRIHEVYTDKVRGCSKIRVEGDMKGTDYVMGVGEIKKVSNYYTEFARTDVYCLNGNLVFKTTNFDPRPGRKVERSDYGYSNYVVSYRILNIETKKGKKILKQSGSRECILKVTQNNERIRFDPPTDPNEREIMEERIKIGRLVKLKSLSGNGIETLFEFSKLDKATPATDVHYWGYFCSSLSKQGKEYEMLNPGATRNEFDEIVNNLNIKYPKTQREACLGDTLEDIERRNLKDKADR